MEPNATPKDTMGRKILRLIWKCLPFILVTLACLAVILPLAAMIGSKKQALAERQSMEKGTPKSLTNVVTLELVPSLIMEKISFPGVAKPWISLEVVSEIKGKVVTKNISEGQRVNKGDILAVVDKSDYQNAYDSALASYETALASQKRLKALVKNNFATASQIDDAVARVKTSKAALDNARLNLDRCTIRSPMEGMVDRIHVENGTFLNSGDPVVKILQIDKLKIEVGIPESDVDAVRNLTDFEITIDALDGRIYTGTYHYLYKTADAMARLYTLEIRVDNKDGLILPDMFARVRIIKQKDEQGLAVPMYSLVSMNETVGVYVEKEGTARFRPVTPGFMDGWKTQVKEGLFPGEHVVVVGHRIIEDGESIHVTKTIRDMEELTR